eukprot:7390592-Prymnesium_polylepis.1
MSWSTACSWALAESLQASFTPRRFFEGLRAAREAPKISDDACSELLGTRLSDDEAEKRHPVSGWMGQSLAAVTMRASEVGCAMGGQPAGRKSGLVVWKGCWHLGV